MKFRFSAPLVLITAMTTAVVAFTGIAIGLSHAFGVAAQDEQLGLMRRIVEDSFRNGEQKALAQAEMIAALPAIARAQCRSAPSALSLPGTPVAICFAAGLAHAA